MLALELVRGSLAITHEDDGDLGSHCDNHCDVRWVR